MSFLPFGRNNLRQSRLSKNNAIPHLLGQRQSTQSRFVQDRAHAPLTFSQALTITAGMAGLVGLLSGVLVRFSLANSSNARFLSPLQTFPELSDWSSDSTPEVADASEESSPELWRSPAELDWDTDTQNFDTFSSESFTDAQSTTEITLEDLETEASPFIELDGTASRASIEKNAQNFDAFADRVEGRRPVDAVDPLKVLSRGPLLGKPTAERSPDASVYENDWEDMESTDSSYESTPQDRFLVDEAHSTIDNDEEAALYDTQSQDSTNYEDDRYAGDRYEDDRYYENESW